MKPRILFNEAGAAGDAGAGGGGAGGGSFLASNAAASGDQGGAAAGAQNQPVYFFRENFAKDGSFVEGWSQALADAGFNRLASKAMTAKDEAGLLRMLDDTIGHASRRQITRPGADADPQQIADWRSLVGAPAESGDYKFLAKGLPEGATRDDVLAGKVEALLHKYNVPVEAGEELSGLYLEQIGAMKDKGAEAITAKLDTMQSAMDKALRAEHGDEFGNFNQRTEDFLTARGIDFKDPMVRYALLTPEIAKIVDEARRASREEPLPGVRKEAFNGTASPRQLAQEIMAQPNWRKIPGAEARVKDLYGQQAVIDARRRTHATV